MTINVNRDALEEFRADVAAAYGRGKGYLGKAVTEALLMWSSVRKKQSAEAKLWQMIEEGRDLGIIPYKNRGELYERR